MKVTDEKTKKVVAEKKFYKADFSEVLEDDVLGGYCTMLLDRVMIKKLADDNEIDVDSESYEEVRSIAMDFSEDLIDPENE